MRPSTRLKRVRGRPNWDEIENQTRYLIFWLTNIVCPERCCIKACKQRSYNGHHLLVDGITQLRKVRCDASLWLLSLFITSSLAHSFPFWRGKLLTFPQNEIASFYEDLIVQVFKILIKYLDWKKPVWSIWVCLEKRRANMWEVCTLL